MKQDVFKKLGELAEKALTEEQASKVVGGLIPGSGSNLFMCIVANSPAACSRNLFEAMCSSNSEEKWCPGNPCDPSNIGGCAGNTIGGGPGTCPLSL